MSSSMCGHACQSQTRLLDCRNTGIRGGVNTQGGDTAKHQDAENMG